MCQSSSRFVIQSLCRQIENVLLCMLCIFHTTVIHDTYHMYRNINVIRDTYYCNFYNSFCRSWFSFVQWSWFIDRDYDFKKPNAVWYMVVYLVFMALWYVIQKYAYIISYHIKCNFKTQIKYWYKNKIRFVLIPEEWYQYAIKNGHSYFQNTCTLCRWLDDR